MIAGDTISINLFKLLAGAVKMRPDRRVILSDTGNFPSDLYVAQGLRNLLDAGLELRTVEPEDVEGAIDESVAVVMLTQVDYRTARRHDMKALTALAHRKGALTIWDLAHSAGAFAIDLAGANADFALGCTYEYLNGGPGAPAFLYVRPDLQQQVSPALAGWWGHEAPFAFDTEFMPHAGILRLQCGTQPILSMVSLDAALDVWDKVDLGELRRKSEALCQSFIALAEERCGAYRIEAVGARRMERRGGRRPLITRLRRER